MSSSEVVLFLHSTGAGPFLWASVPDAVVGHRKTILQANLGYPPNPPVARGEVVTVSDDAASALRAVPDTAERVHVVAHSYGALVGLHVIRALGPRAASAFLFEPILFGALVEDAASDPEAVAEAHALAAHPTFLGDEELGGREAWIEAFIDYWNRPGAWAKSPAHVRAYVLAAAWKMFQEVRAVFFERTPFGAWALPPASTVAMGERSPASSRAMAKGLARGRSGVALVDIPGVGHMAPLNQPGPVHDELRRHFERLETT